MKHKKVLYICLVVVLVVIAAAIVAVMHHSTSEPKQPNTQKVDDISSDKTDDNATNNDNNASNGDTSGSITTGNNKPSEAKKQEEVTLPYPIPNTQLKLMNVSGYDGVFLEDGSDVEISGITAVVVQNCGEQAVEYAQITLELNGQTLNFEGSDIPAGAAIVLEELNRTPYADGTITDCHASVAEVDSLPMSSDAIRITENNDDTISVKNISGETIPCVRVFYKFYYEDEAAYVGGITYVAKITDLPANAEKVIAPSHYASGYSQIVMVRTYDSAE